MPKHVKAILVSSKEVAINTYEMVLKTKKAKKHAIPGQFVHIQVPNRPDLLLRRPISINSINTSERTITLIVQVVGEGTQVLCNLEPNTELDIIGPVGRGFMLDENIKKAAVVGGGIGVAPLRYLVERHPNVDFHAFLGYRSKKFAYQIKEFENICHLHLHTDDGSAGKKGFATDTLDKILSEEKFDAVYACGPTPMFKALQCVMDKYEDVPCYVSLEERMGCGIGGCKVCTCEVVEKGQSEYKTVCQDGPVFDIRKVVL